MKQATGGIARGCDKRELSSTPCLAGIGNQRSEIVESVEMVENV